MPASAPERVATLWQLTWTDNSQLACCVYRDGMGLYLRVESNSALVVNERFELQPRAVARAQALRESLKRRGWQESQDGVPADRAGDDPLPD